MKLLHTFPIEKPSLKTKIMKIFFKNESLLLLIFFFYISIGAFIVFYNMQLHVSYNDAMSHLNIARRVFDNLQPGLAQLGSVWLPLPHLLMLPTVWNTFLWQTGLSGAIVSMFFYVITCFFTYKTVLLMTNRKSAAYFSSLIVALNLNFIYIQTTALTEPLFMGLFAASIYYLYKWQQKFNSFHVVIMSALACLMTLTRYDGWFVFLFTAIGITFVTYLKFGYKRAEGTFLLYITLGGLGILLWILYNLIIFNDPFYFALGEFSAKSQQQLLLDAGELQTKGNMIFSLITYYYALIDNLGIIIFYISLIGLIYFIINKRSIISYTFALTLLSTVIFNILALYLGFSVIFLPEVTGNSWFNVRYGLMGLPVAAIFIGYLMSVRSKVLKALLVILILFQISIFYITNYAVTITDGTKGSSQKNVRPIGKILRKIYYSDKGLILGSAASHDAIFFASAIPLKEFIHEGVEKYWKPTLANPETRAKYIVMRTNDNLDSVCRAICKIKDLNAKYTLIYDGEYADIYKRRW